MKCLFEFGRATPISFCVMQPKENGAAFWFGMDRNSCVRPCIADSQIAAPLHKPPNYAASRAGTGNAVTDLIFSMANRDVTFFNATAPISFL
jgi:hypothetical protein